MPTRALSKFQFGVEGTNGTAVAADTILAGAQVKGVPIDRRPHFPEDALGVRARSARSEIHTLLVEDTLTFPSAYFQLLPLLFSLGLKGGITASEQTASQSDYLWAFAPSMTASNALNSITLEMGDDVQAYEIEYVMVNRIKVSGSIAQDGTGSPVQIECDYFGRQVTPTTFTGALSLPTMTGMNAKLARLYKDALWANKGTTEVTSILRDFEFEIMTGVHPKVMGSANKYFTTHGEGIIDVMLTLTLEGIAAADTIFDEFQAGTAKAYSLQIPGPQIGSGDPHLLQMDVFGVPEMVEPLASESNGNNLHQVLIHGLYDTTGAQIVDVNVTTNVAAI
jgi:hypothetical protein